MCNKKLVTALLHPVLKMSSMLKNLVVKFMSETTI